MIRPDLSMLNAGLDTALTKGYAGLVRPLLFRSAGGDPELIHERLIAQLGQLPAPVRRAAAAVLAGGSSPVEVTGMRFDRPVGVAAGLDKNGLAAAAWAGLGFGFAELGTVTPRPQPGNPQPRLFRLPGSKAIINRMGFNNNGATELADRLFRQGVRRGNRALGIPLGISIGKNKTTDLDRAGQDYIDAFDAVAQVADYVAINVSSPNTPGLRRLQAGAELTALVGSVVARAAERDPGNPMPVWVKLAPDNDDEGLDQALEVCERAGASAVIATNTTVSRHGVRSNELHIAQQTGGLSGAPLTERALAVVSRIAQRSSLPVVGVGGIMTAADASAMFDAGARLVQLYTGFIYGGPGLVRQINNATQHKELR